MSVGGGHVCPSWWGQVAAWPVVGTRSMEWVTSVTGVTVEFCVSVVTVVRLSWGMHLEGDCTARNEVNAPTAGDRGLAGIS